MQQVPLYKKDIELIGTIMTENNINSCNVIYDNYDNGIGYTLDVEFGLELHGRPAKVKISILSEGEW